MHGRRRVHVHIYSFVTWSWYFWLKKWFAGARWHIDQCSHLCHDLFLIMHSLNKFLLYVVTVQAIVSLVPDSCWAIIRNGNSIRGKCHKGHYQKLSEWRLFLVFLDNLAVVLVFIWHCRINTIYVHCQKISNSFPLAAKQGKKVCQRFAFLPVSKTHANFFL